MGTKAGKWPTGVVQKVGREALALAREFRERIEPRLAAGLLDGHETDLTELDDKRAAASNALGSLKLATRQQGEAVHHAIELLAAVRQAVVRAGATATQRAAFGTTRPYTREKVGSVVAALDSFITAAAADVEFTRSAGVLPADVDALKTARAALVSADQSQEAQKSTRKQPVLQRNALQRRIEAAISAIISAGTVAFVGNAETAARFRALVPSAGTRAAKE